MSRDVIIELADDIDKAMDNSDIAGLFAVASALACGLVRAIGCMRSVHESNPVAQASTSQNMRDWRESALSSFDVWEDQALHMVKRISHFAGPRGSGPGTLCESYMCGLIDAGWIRMADTDGQSGSIDITKIGRGDG